MSCTRSEGLYRGVQERSHQDHHAERDTLSADTTMKDHDETPSRTHPSGTRHLDYRTVLNSRDISLYTRVGYSHSQQLMHLGSTQVQGSRRLAAWLRALQVRDAFYPRPNTYTHPHPRGEAVRMPPAAAALELAKGRARRSRAVVYVPSCVLALYSLPRSPPRAAARCAQTQRQRREREGANQLQLPYCVSRAMAKPKTQWPKSSAAMPFVAPAESRWYRSWIS